MPVRINISQSAVTARVTGAFQAGLPQLSEEILNDCNQFCKEDTGTLIASSLVHSRPQEGQADLADALRAAAILGDTDGV